MKNSSLFQAGYCAVVGALVGIASALGVFARGDGTVMTVTSIRGTTYEAAASGVYAYNSEQVVAEGIGWDVFTLVVIMPALLVAAVLVARGALRGRLLAAGLFGYTFYMYLEYSVTWAFGPLFALHVLIAALSLIGLVWLVGAIAPIVAELPVASRFPFRAWAFLSLGMAVLLGVMWTGRIVGALQSPAAADAVLFGDTTLTVQAMDLVLVLPTLIISGLLALRRTAIAEAAGAIVVVAYTAMAAAIAAMLVSAGVRNGTFEWPPIVLFAAAALAAIAVGYEMYVAIGRAVTATAALNLNLRVVLRQEGAKPV